MLENLRSFFNHLSCISQQRVLSSLVIIVGLLLLPLAAVLFVVCLSTCSIWMSLRLSSEQVNFIRQPILLSLPVSIRRSSSRLLRTVSGTYFHKIWEGAEQGVNEFKPFTVDWWDVPGRDERWKEQTIANTSKLQFDQEFGNTFFGTGDTLINAETLLSFSAKSPCVCLRVVF